MSDDVTSTIQPPRVTEVVISAQNVLFFPLKNVNSTCFNQPLLFTFLFS